MIYTLFCIIIVKKFYTTSITSKSKYVDEWIEFVISNDGLKCKETNIIGKINTELDEVDFVKSIIYEDKNAKGSYMDNPDVPQTEEQWAQKQILKKPQKKNNFRGI